jgi:hypothetical protein
MKQLLIICFCGCLLALGACTAEVVATRPAPVVYERGVAPGPDYEWVGGDYIWVGGSYRWQAGHWNRRRPGRTWHEGSWEGHGKGYRWRRGHY